MTSGLPTVSHFLSNELMEPEDGAQHYTETLVRLPNVGFYYEPLPIEEVPVSRAELGLRPDAVAYFCCQSLFKYLPRYDDVFARIARGVPTAQFFFISRSTPTDAIFRERMDRAFAGHGLRAEDHCVFSKTLPGPRFDAAIRVMDIFLDSLGWSGGNTTMESIAHDLPVVTSPGHTMRSRHTAAIMTMMGMSDCISASVDAYVERAIALGNDASMRAALRERVAANKHQVLRDRAAITGLEEFLRSVA